ncbi:uncharacterized protein LOC142166988 [Nicotiana tabacum]|uniref:Uncharacterized protein LOC142166988 n=1 Tax=Nicotiana tabacum TaxID=4097 RepID=A0AC58SE46_TOBAC
MDELCESHLMIQGPWIHENKVVSSTYHQCLKYCEDGVGKKIVVDDKPFTEAKSYFADTKFYLKNYVSKVGKVDDVILTKSVAKRVDVTTSKENITVEKDQVLHDRNKMNKASSSKKVTHVLRYVPKARKVEDPSFELQDKVLRDLTIPIKRIDAIKSSTKLLKGFVKSLSHNSLLNLALPTKHTDEGFDPDAYKLLAKVVYDHNEPSKLGKLPPKPSNPTQKMMMEKGYPLKQSHEGFGYKQPPIIRISIKRDEDAKDAPPELEEGVKTTVDALKEVNLGVVEDPKPTYISASLTGDEESKYIELLKEFKDVFAWSYKEMSGLDPKVDVHHLAVKRGACPRKQAQRRFRPELVSLIETEVNKLIKAGFVREVKYPTWISSIVPVRKKNGQIRVCVDFRDLNNACPKDEFPLPIPELMIDATTGYEAMSFMDGSSGYNQIRMAPEDEELTAFCTPKSIYCYKVIPLDLKNAGATYQRAMQNIFDGMLHKMWSVMLTTW